MQLTCFLLLKFLVLLSLPFHSFGARLNVAWFEVFAFHDVIKTPFKVILYLFREDGPKKVVASCLIC